MKPFGIITVFLLCFLPDNHTSELGAAENLFGESTQLEEGWEMSPWFGYYSKTNSDWIHHHGLGWLYPVDASQGGVWFYHPITEWFWSDATVYPWLYYDKLATWIYVAKYEEADSTMQFYDHRSGEWLNENEFTSENFANLSDPEDGNQSNDSNLTTEDDNATSLDNILLLIVDDWGIDASPLFNDTASDQASFAPMPNVESLAASGLRFNNAYAQPLCSPTRAGILTGRHAFRNGVGTPEGATLPESEITIPEIFALQASPYRLASFGKWHLGGGRNGPLDLGGWNEFAGIVGGGVDDYLNWSKTINGNVTQGYSIYTTTDQVNDAIDFIELNEDKPWFVWLGFNAAHTPFHNPPSVDGNLESYPDYPTTDGKVTGANRKYAFQAMLEALDTEIGRLLASVDLNSTNLILIGDNGTTGSVIQEPFDATHSKGTLFQGGIRVPFLMCGPAVSQTGVSNQLVHTTDLYSTILDLAGVEPDQENEGIDSKSLLPIITSGLIEERKVISEMYGNSDGGNGRALLSSNHPNYKLIIWGDPRYQSDDYGMEMYDLSIDPNEQSQLSLPPSQSDNHFAAYQELLAIDAVHKLEPVGETKVALYLELPRSVSGPAGVPSNSSVVPVSISIDGEEASFIARHDRSDEFNQYWVKCEITESNNQTFQNALVTFPDNPNTGDSRVFQTPNLYLEFDDQNASQSISRILMHPTDGVFYYLSDSSTEDGWTQFAHEASLGIDSEMSYLDGNSTFERKARVIVQNFRNNFAANAFASLEINGSVVSNALEIVHDFAENQMVVTGNGVPNYTPTVMGIEVTEGWNAAVEGGFQSLKFSEDNLGASGGNNPNKVSVTHQQFKIPLRPFMNGFATETNLGTVGVALNGIPVFNPFEDPQQTMAYGRIFSSCCGHPAQGGIYHYHKYPTCLRLIEDQWLSEKDKCDLIDSLLVPQGHSPLIGFAIDGWPIYGPVGWISENNQTGKIMRSSYTGDLDAAGNPSFLEGSGDLDECNGITSPTPEFPEGIYHYVMSLEANADGTVRRYVNPHFGYDVRNTLKKHDLMPESWNDDVQYVADLKAGFLVGGIQIDGTDEFNRFAHFIRRMQDTLNENGMSEVAAEFETMKIAYPFTIRKYRGNPSN